MDWKNRTIGFRLLLPFFFTGFFLLAENAPVASTQGDAVALREAKEARELAEKRILDLELELGKAKKELEKIRSRYADFYLESHAVVDRMRQLELQASHLIRRKEDLDGDALAAQALEALNLAGRRQLEVEDAVHSFEQYLNSVLDVLQPSDALRRELSERIKALHRAVENSLKPLSIVARRGGGGPGKQGCGVLAVNEELQLVVLDCGFLAGLKTGSVWRLMSGDSTVTARLRVVEVRPEISAAVVIQGDMASLTPGCQLSAE